MDTKKLRQKILDLAIRGKLVPQDPNDEPASVLLERIKAEKEQLIKEGKIKRSKKSESADKPHYENVPFEIPESWVWTTVDELLINRDSERIPLSSAVRKKQFNKVYDYYGAAGAIDKVEGYLFNERLLLIGEDGANLLSRSKDNAFFADGKYWVNNHAHVLDCCCKPILIYVSYLINSMSLEPFVTGTAQPKLSQDNLNKIPIPLPPFKEQGRIVSEIEKCFSTIDQIDNNMADLESYIKKVKLHILDLAISGKLVPQDPADEPAIDLLKRINPNFKPCDNSHYENKPETWQEIEMGTICKLYDGEKISGPSMIYIDVKYLRGTKEGEVVETGKFVTKGSTLILVDGENSGEVFTTPIDGYQGSTFKILGISEFFDKEYVLLLIKRSQKLLRENKVGSAIPHLNKKMFRELIVPVPPLLEQTRIVKAVKDLFNMLDAITAELL